MKILISAIALLASAVGPAQHAAAASLNCEATTRAIDKATCTSPKVSPMDSKTTGYSAMVGALGSSSKFYRSTVWGIGPGMKTCEAFDSGAPAALWGNRESVKVEESISANGRVLMQTGTHRDRTTDTYRFFLRKEECIAAAGKTDVAQSANSAAASFLAAPLGKSKAVIERRFGGFSFCGNVQGFEMCTATNTLTSPPPITTADGDMPCIIGNDASFTFDGSGQLTGVKCDAFPQAWTKIRSAMQATAGRGKRDVKQFMGMVSEISTWSTGAIRATLIHDTGPDLRGEPIDAYSVLVTVAH